MSDFTQCNFCKLKVIKAQAKKEGKKVTVLDDVMWTLADWGAGTTGSNVYVHPASVNIRKMKDGEDGERAKYRKAWMMEIGKHCEC